MLSVACNGYVGSGKGRPTTTPDARPRAATPAQTTAVPAPSTAKSVASVEPCPADLRLTIPRTIDARIPKTTLPGPYAREHKKEARPEELLKGEEAVERVIAIERAHPEVLPSAYLAAVIATPKDAALRLRMARCELDRPDTIRRASYDASLAYFLGASKAEAYAIVHESLYPGGSESTSCTGPKDCAKEATCDKKLGICVSPRDKAASKASQVELDVEDILARAHAARITREELASDRYKEGDLTGTFAYGRLHKCTGGLCTFSRYDLRQGQTSLVHWDIRYHGEEGVSVEGPGNMTETEKLCYDATGSISLPQCTSRCAGQSPSDRATCELRCTTHCKRDFRQ